MLMSSRDADSPSPQIDTPIYRLESLTPGTVVAGPAIILDKTQTLIIHPANVATVLIDHVYIDVGLGPRKKLSTTVVDPIQLSIFVRRHVILLQSSRPNHKLELTGFA